MVHLELSPGEGRDTANLAEAIWHDSYEAEQHLLHLGQAEEPVCWTLTGFASGYLSFCNRREIYCVEERCRGKGDAVCQVVGRLREDWGDRIASQLHFYQKECMDHALTRATDELKQVELELRARKKELGRRAPAADVSGIVAQSEAMQRVLDLARRVAKVDSTILITGESGVGKERVARFIHEESTRTGGPFLAINCGAVPESLLESELFGHARGAFTGATQDRPGLFEAANGGTLFLDEIGEVPSTMQVKLLRTLQEREVRERRDDILPLARAFLAESEARTGRKVTGLTPRAANQLVRHGWPGNVRELENAVERAVVLARGSRVDLEDLPEEVRLALPSTYAPGDVRPLDEVERDYILAVLRANHGNKALAAQQLKIGTATLYRKLKQYQDAARGR